MDTDQWTKDHSDMQRAFEEGSVWIAADEELLRYLRSLTTGNVRNAHLTTVEINRATTILAIFSQRRLEEDRRRNDIANQKNQIRARQANVIALGSFLLAALGVLLMRG